MSTVTSTPVKLVPGALSVLGGLGLLSESEELSSCGGRHGTQRLRELASDSSLGNRRALAERWLRLQLCHGADL